MKKQKEWKKIVLSVLVLILAAAAVVCLAFSLRDRSLHSSPAVNTDNYEIPAQSQTDPKELPEADLDGKEKDSSENKTAENTGPDTKDGDVESVIIAYPNGASEED